MTIIKTKDFTLRPIRASDAQTLFEIETDKDNIKNMMSYCNNFEEFKKDIKKKIVESKKTKPSEKIFIIETKEGPAGHVSIHDLYRPHREHKAAISYALHPSFRGKGVATKAVKKATAYAFKEFNINRLEARCRTFNKASARVLEKAGFTLEGIHKKDLKKDGKYLHNMYWSIVK